MGFHARACYGARQNEVDDSMKLGPGTVLRRKTRTEPGTDQRAEILIHAAQTIELFARSEPLITKNRRAPR